MKLLVFIPGMMGSELRSKSSGKRVWPPSLLNIISKNTNIDSLLADDLEATRPISTVAGFYSVYRSLLRDIEACGYTLGGAKRRYIQFAYDWRQANEITAQALSERLQQESEAQEIVFLTHSMGGLVARYCIESGVFDNQQWFNKVTQLITLGTPHNGAPAALKQVAGFGANLGLSAVNVQRLASDSRYPSAYQLIPPNENSMLLMRSARNELPKTISAFDSEIVTQLLLNPSNIDAAKNFWAHLDIAKKPESVDYFSVVGSAHNTLYRLDWDGRTLTQRESKDSGDGTVPTSSCLNATIPHVFSRKKHASVFADRNVRVQLYRMLGAERSIKPHSATGEVSLSSATAMGISTDREEYNTNDTMEVAVSYATPQTNPWCRFQIAQMYFDDANPGDEFAPMSPVGEPMSVRFEGVNVTDFKFNMSLDLAPGVYELQTSADIDDPERTFFMVAEL